MDGRKGELNERVIEERRGRNAKVIDLIIVRGNERSRQPTRRDAVSLTS